MQTLYGWSAEYIYRMSLLPKEVKIFRKIPNLVGRNISKIICDSKWISCLSDGKIHLICPSSGIILKKLDFANVVDYGLFKCESDSYLVIIQPDLASIFEVNFQGFTGKEVWSTEINSEMAIKWGRSTLLNNNKWIR